MTEKSRKEPQSSPPDPPTQQGTEPAVPFEQHLAGRSLPTWEVAALKADAGWLTGQEVTVAQFNEALTSLHQQVIE